MYGLQLLHQAGLEQQCAELTGGLAPFNTAGFLRQAHLTRLACRRLEMRHHTAAHTHTFTDVKRQRPSAVKQVNTGAIRYVVHRGFEQRRQRRAALQQCLRMFAQGLATQLGGCLVQPGQHHLDIAHRTVPRQGVEAVALHDGIQAMAAVLWVEQARQANCAQGSGLELDASAGKLME